MEIIFKELPSNHDLIIVSDDHQGNALRYDAGVEKMKDFILKEKNRFLVHLGDEMEAFYIDDPRYSAETTISCPLEQQKQVIKTYEPLVKAKRMLTLLMGNHTYKLIHKVGDITKDTCDKLKIPYGKYWCKLEVSDKHGLIYKAFLEHGSKGINSIADDPVRRLANMRLMLKRHLYFKAGDCLIMAKGHCHKLIVCPPVPELYLITDEKGEIKQKYTHSGDEGLGRIPPDTRWYISSGSFLKTSQAGVVSYSERAEYDPVELGYVVCKIRDRKVESVERVVL